MSAKSPEDVRMTFGEHIEELRRRILASIYAFAALFFVTFFFHEFVRNLAYRPYEQAVSSVQEKIDVKHAEDPIVFRPAVAFGFTGPMPVLIPVVPKRQTIDPRPTVLSPQEGIFQDIKLSSIVALLACAPFLLYQLWAFVRAGLYENERRAIGPYLPLTIGLFVAGAAFGYFVMLPMILNALIDWNSPERVNIQNRLEYYLSLFYTFTFTLGLIFEIPVVMMMLTRVGIVTAKAYMKGWRWAVLGGVVVGAVVNPAPSIETQLVFAAPIVGLYFLGIGLAYLAERGRAKIVAAS